MDHDSTNFYGGDLVYHANFGYGRVASGYGQNRGTTLLVQLDSDRWAVTRVYKLNVVKIFRRFEIFDRVRADRGPRAGLLGYVVSLNGGIGVRFDNTVGVYRAHHSELVRVTDSVPTTTTTSKDENMTHNTLPQVGDIVTFKPGFDHAGETATVIAVNPNARKYPVQVEYAPETQHRSLKSIVEPPRKFDFKIGDRIEAALGDSILRGEVVYAPRDGSYIEIEVDGARSTTIIEDESKWEVTKLIELPTKQFAQIRVNGTVLVLIGGKFVNPITNRTRTPRRVTEQVVNEGRDYEVLFEGLDA